MRSWILWLLPVLLAGPVTVLPAQEVVELRGTTTLVGRQGAVVRVRVPQSASLTIDRDTEIEGVGDFVGFALSPYPIQLDTSSPPSPEIGSVLVVGRVAGTIHYQSRSTPQVDAGEYLLYLLADGSPARVTFHLSGLDGALELAPTYPASFDARVLEPRVTIEANPVLYSAGDGGDVSAPGLGLILIWLRSQTLAGLYPGPSGAYGFCLYAGDPLDATVAYQPGCPLRGRPPTVFYVLAPGTPGVVFGALYHLYPGRWGLGAWYESPTLVDSSGAGVFWLTLAVPELPPPMPTSVVSRRIHSTAGTFDVDLPLTGNPGIECRSAGANNSHQIIFKFALPVSFSGASVTPATGKTAEVDGLPIRSPDSKEVTVNLKNVSDAQTIMVTLLAVSDGTKSGDVAVRILVLGGDTNEDSRVNVGDTNQTKSNSGSLTSTANFRTDVNLDGRINVGDTNFVKAHAGANPTSQTLPLQGH